MCLQTIIFKKTGTHRMTDENHSTSQDVSKMRLQYYKSSLNILRGRRYQLHVEKEGDATAAALMPDYTLPLIMEHVDSIQNFMGHLVYIRNSFQTLMANLYNKQNKDIINEGKYKKAIYDISEISKACLSFNLDDGEIFNPLRIKYGRTQEKYHAFLESQTGVVACKGSKDPETQKLIAKAERRVRKINVTRIITRLLMAAFVSDHKAHPEINSLRTPFRRDLTLDDFKTTWDVGLI